MSTELPDEGVGILTSRTRAGKTSISKTVIDLLLTRLPFLIWPSMATGAVADNVRPIEIGSRLELFVDGHLIDSMKNVRLKLHSPRSAGKILILDRPWEGVTCDYHVVFQGGKLVLNYATSAAGSIRVEVQDAYGEVINGFGLKDCSQIFGDRLEGVVSWKIGSDLSMLAGKPIRLRFVIRDADLYSLRFK